MGRIEDTFHVVEFYRTGETRPFARRNGVLTIPAVGHGVDVFGVSGEVVTVNWNMDYAGRADEQWRCNIYIKPSESKEGQSD